MCEETAVLELGRPVRPVWRRRLPRAATWVQLVRFALVGASGYLVNLAAFWVAQRLGAGYEVAAVVAFLVAVTSNFVWNRHWTFAARGGRASGQAVRFLIVSVAAFGVNLGELELLVRTAGLPELPAQAVAVLGATPFSFLANKLWSFRA